MAVLSFFTVSVLATIKKEWFIWIYRIEGGDKLAHFAGAALLSFFLVLGLSSFNKNNVQKNVIFAIIAAASLVVIEELVQLVIPSRHFSLIDIAWSLSGVLIVGVVAVLTNKFRASN